jgi:hypothetical protein
MAPPDRTEKRIVAHGEHQSLRETRCRAPAQGQPKVMDDIMPGRSPCPRRQNTALKALCEDAPAT